MNRKLPKGNLVSSFEYCGQGRNRTADASLFRAALYRLSYLAVTPEFPAYQTAPTRLDILQKSD